MPIHAMRGASYELEPRNHSCPSDLSSRGPPRVVFRQTSRPRRSLAKRYMLSIHFLVFELRHVIGPGVSNSLAHDPIEQDADAQHGSPSLGAPPVHLKAISCDENSSCRRGYESQISVDQLPVAHVLRRAVTTHSSEAHPTSWWN